MFLLATSIESLRPKLRLVMLWIIALLLQILSPNPAYVVYQSLLSMFAFQRCSIRLECRYILVTSECRRRMLPSTNFTHFVGRYPPNQPKNATISPSLLRTPTLPVFPLTGRASKHPRSGFCRLKLASPSHASSLPARPNMCFRFCVYNGAFSLVISPPISVSYAFKCSKVTERERNYNSIF